MKAIGLDGQSISAYSAPVPMEKAAQEMERYAPKIRVKYHEQNGTVLLYPAYSFVKIPHAVSYEVEITDEEPEILTAVNRLSIEFAGDCYNPRTF